MYTASPTMSWPNHMFTQSGTSCGCTSTGPTCECRWQTQPSDAAQKSDRQRLPADDQGGGPSKTYPQFTIYDSMALDNVSFGLYANVTCGVSGHPPCTEAAPAFDTYMAENHGEDAIALVDLLKQESQQANATRYFGDE